LWIRDPREGVHSAGRYRPLTVEGANLYELIVRANDRKTRRDDALKTLIYHRRICSSRKHTSIRRYYERGSTEPGVSVLSKSTEGKELTPRKIFYRLITSSEHTDDIEVTLKLTVLESIIEYDQVPKPLSLDKPGSLSASASNHHRHTT
jgi:hypothetical protein